MSDAPEPRGTSSGQLTAVLESAPEGAVLYDALGTILWCNPAAGELVGRDPADLVGVNGTVHIHPDDLDVAATHWIEMLSEPGRPIVFDQQLVAADGEVRWVRTQFVNQLENPAVGAVICHFHDRSAEREALDHLRQSQRLEIAGLLTGQLAHDFNNILTTIIGNIDLAMLGLNDDGDAVARDRLKAALTASRRASDLIFRFLAFSRKQLTRREPVDLAELVQRHEPILARLVPPQATLRLEVADDPRHQRAPTRVWVDPLQIEQVVANLVVNARDALESDVGTITVSIAVERRLADELPDDSLVEGEYVVVTVSDDGCGINPDDLERLFEPFWTTKGVGEGTGLGLAIVHDIVTESRGFVTVDSVVGEGTSIRVHLPRYLGEGRIEPLTPADPVVDVFGSGRVMVVDDDLGVLDFVARCLGALGYDVYTAASYAEGLAMFDEHGAEFDLLICDSVLNESSGHALARDLVSRSTMPLILMSGYVGRFADEVDDIATEILPKPFGVGQLGETVGRALATSPRRRDDP